MDLVQRLGVCAFGWAGCDNYTGGHLCNRDDRHTERHRCDCGATARATDHSHLQREVDAAIPAPIDRALNRNHGICGPYPCSDCR